MKPYTLIAILFLVVCFFKCSVGNGQKLKVGNSQKPVSDTTPPKQYITKLSYDIYSFNRKLDTLSMFGQILGKSLSVDQADSYKIILNRILVELQRSAIIDSTKK